MALNKSTHVAPSKPQLLRFIIALFFVKSKPTNITVQDYLAQLRSWITQGRRPDTSTDAHSHLDTLGFWKDAYRKSEETAMELRAKIFNLEQSRERKDEQTSQTSTGIASQKRKRASAELMESSRNRATKQAKSTAPAASSQAEDAWLPLSADDRETLAQNPHSQMSVLIQKNDADGSDTAFLHNIYLLQQIRTRQNPPAREIASILSQISMNITRIISTIAQSVISADPNRVSNYSHDCITRAQERKVIHTQTIVESELDSKLLVIGRIFPWLLNCMDALDQTPMGKILQGQVIYSYISLFRHILERICDSAASGYEANAIRGNENRIANQKRKPARRSEASSSASLKDKTIIKICHLLTIMAASLNASKLVHRHILDGFLFLLLTRVGRLLSRFVFHEGPISITVEEISHNTAANLPRATLQEFTTIHPEQDRFVLKTQAPCLIYILSRLVPLTARTSPFTLAENARKKLQHTLLNSVFGQQTAEFVDALREPPLLDLDLMEDVLAKRTDEDVGDWYKSEIWRLVGWDMLTKHIQWPEDEVGSKV